MDVQHAAGARGHRRRQDPARLLAERGIEIAGGFGPLAGKVFRIGLMGSSSSEENVLLILDVLEKALRAEGYKGGDHGPRRAEKVLAAKGGNG